jgi:hypothetical protein
MGRKVLWDCVACQIWAHIYRDNMFSCLFGTLISCILLMTMTEVTCEKKTDNRSSTSSGRCGHNTPIY